MKFINLLFGIIIFSGLTVLFFDMFSTMGAEYSTQDTTNYNTLKSQYNFISDVTNSSGGDNDNSIRSIEDKIKSGKYESTSDSFFIVSKAGLDASKLIVNSVFTMGKISYFITNALGINPLITTMIISLVVIFLVIVVLIMITKSKPETD